MEKEDIITNSKQSAYRILEKVYERKDKKSSYYIAEDTNLGRKVGIKQIQKDRIDKQREEVKMLLRISEQTPYVPRIYDIIEQFDKIFIIMEHIEGKTLRECLITEKQKVSQSHQYIFSKLVRILQDISCEHRDIKPENIILTKNQNGNYKEVFLIDFGLASLYPFVEEGTKGYQAPEQKRDIDETIKAEENSKIDMYTCGILLYEMIMGNPPIEGKNYSMEVAHQEWTIFEELANKGISKAEIDFIKKCLQVNPKDRFYNKRNMSFSYFNIGKGEKNGRNI